MIAAAQRDGNSLYKTGQTPSLTHHCAILLYALRSVFLSL